MTNLVVQGCSNHGCRIKWPKPGAGSVGTNGQCNCAREANRLEIEKALYVRDQEIERLQRDNAAMQSRWDDMQQGFVEVFGEPVQDAIELLGATEKLRAAAHEPSYEPDCSTGIGGVTLMQMAENIKHGRNPYTETIAGIPFVVIEDPKMPPDQIEFRSKDGQVVRVVGIGWDAQCPVCKKIIDSDEVYGSCMHTSDGSHRRSL